MELRKLRYLATATIIGLAATIGVASAASADSIDESVYYEGGGFHTALKLKNSAQGLDTWATTGTFELRTEDGVSFETYCIELRVPFNTDRNHSGLLSEWDSFQGTNNFATNPKVNGIPTRELVSWISLNSYPAVSLDDLAQAANVTGLTKKEAVAATQGAIWHLTDGFIFGGVDKGSADQTQRVKAVYDYLLGDANVGAAEPSRELPTVDITPESLETSDAIVGPFTIESNSTDVALKIAPSGAILVDAQGDAIDTARVPAGTQVFAKVDESVEPGTEFTITATTQTSTFGSYIVNIKDPKSGERQQTIIVSHGESHNASTAATFTTLAQPETPPVETTPVETTPVETTPVETTPVETTPVETTPVETTPVETTPTESTPAETIPTTAPETSPAVPTQEPTKPESDGLAQTGATDLALAAGGALVLALGAALTLTARKRRQLS